MSECVFSFILGVVFGLGAAILIYSLNEGQLLNDCQAKLPRDHYCTLVAVPEDEV